MSEVDLVATIREFHERQECSGQPDTCRWCSADWPCLDERAAREIEQLKAKEVRITSEEFDRMRAENTRLREALEEARIKIDSEGAVLAMTVDRLGGMVEGHITARLNFLQRVDELRDIEHQFRCIEEKP